MQPPFFVKRVSAVKKRIPKKLRTQIKSVYNAYTIKGGRVAARTGGQGGSLSEHNYKHNEKLSLKTDHYLTDQAAGTEGKYRYGITKTTDTGCEIIAVYNLLLREGIRCDFRDLIRRFDSGKRGRVLFGLFGTSIRGMQDYLRKAGISVRMIPGSKLSEMDQAEAGILSFWWSESSFRIHTVMIEKNAGGGITAYNYDPWHRIYQISARSVSDLIRRQHIRPIAFLAVK